MLFFLCILPDTNFNYVIYSESKSIIFSVHCYSHFYLQVTPNSVTIVVITFELNKIKKALEDIIH